MAADRSASLHGAENGPDLAALAKTHQDRLLSVYEEGRREYVGLPLEFDAFTPRALERVQRRVARTGLALTPDRVEQALSCPHVADLFLAIACDEGVAGAWEVFADRFGPRLREQALRGGAARREAGDIAREIPGELCAPPPTGNTRTHLGTYDGTGSLLGWLRVIVLRRVVDRRRAHVPESLDDHSEGDPARSAELPDASSAGTNPSSLAIDREARAKFESALVVAWHALTPQESVAVLAKYRDGLAQREITHLLGVGDSRVSRVLDRATTKIREAFRQCIEPAELTQFWAAMTNAVQNHLANPGEPPDYPGEGISTRRGVDR